MKKIFYTILACSAITASCSGFLDKTPTDKLSSDLVYTNQTLAENAVRGVYNNLIWDFNSTDNVKYNWDAYAGVLDPVDYFRGSIAFLSGNVLSTNGVFSTFWKQYYEGINRANDVINNLENVPGMKTELKQRRIAECRFIRALYYYKLNCRWRGVPVYLENLAPDEYKKARSSEEKVWETIIDDCTYCIDNANLPDKYSASDSDYGRVTKGAAYVLRGKVYLWLKKYDLAEADFLKVGELGYGLYEGNYADLFQESNEKCREMIFSIQFIPQKGFGNALSYIYGNMETVSKGNDQFVFFIKIEVRLLRDPLKIEFRHIVIIQEIDHAFVRRHLLLHLGLNVLADRGNIVAPFHKQIFQCHHISRLFINRIKLIILVAAGFRLQHA